jgi:IPT/TIG domain-containing protein
MLRRVCAIISLLVLGSGVASLADAQTTTYHLHAEQSSTIGLRQLKTIGPDQSTTVAIQTADLKGLGPRDGTLGYFDTQVGVPGVGGVIPANSTLTFNLWMKKTALFGTVYPQVSAGGTYSGPPVLCSLTNGTTPISQTSTTASLYTVSCSTGSSPITMSSTDRITVYVYYHMTAGPGNKSMKVELDIEGTTDSTVSVPNALAPSITSLSPSSAITGTSMTVTGTNFGTSQGTVQFGGGATGTVTSWTNCLTYRNPCRSATRK